MKKILLAIFCAALIFSATAEAQMKSDRFAGDANIIDTTTLKVGLRTVTLWGIKGVKAKDTLLQLHANELLERLVSGGKVSCRIIKDEFPKATARCLSPKEADLGLELINNGFAVIDKAQMDNNEFSKIYAEAQKTARTNNAGIWAELKKDDERIAIVNTLSNYMTDSQLMLLASAIAGAFLCGLVFSIFWLKKNLSHHKDEMEKIYYKEYLLKAKEKTITISLIRGELEENRSKTEAFMALYQDMLKNIKESDRVGSLKLLGDTVRTLPVCKKEIFEMNNSKLPILDMSVVGKLTRLYSKLNYQDVFVEINKKAQLEVARGILKEAIKNSKEQMDEIDKAILLLDKEYSLVLQILEKAEGPKNTEI